MATDDRLWTVKRQGYEEMHWKRGDEPRRRWLHVVAPLGRSTWHVTVTFEGSLHSDMRARAKKEDRRKDLENLCDCLDFDCLQLLDNTVTELLIKRAGDTTPRAYENDSAFPDRDLPLKTPPDSSGEYALCYADLRFCLREDPRHVRFPALPSSIGIPMKPFSEIRKIEELSSGVSKVHVATNDEEYLIFKEVDRPLYMPADSKALYQELQNLQLCQGVESIVQLVAAVVSQNPYQTVQPNEPGKSTRASDATAPIVLRGILLEYHSNGTLQDTLRSASQQTILPWRQWALQITRALHCLHQHGITHMDLKPSNIVISSERAAILIDISGIGGTTYEWLAPEMRLVSDPLSKDIESRKRNDVWALGQVLSEMAHASSNSLEKSPLNSIALAATTEDPSLRISLRRIISELSCSSEP